MSNPEHFYIDGRWVPGEGSATLAVIDPSTEKAYAEIALGSVTDIDKAVMAARKAFAAFAGTSRHERMELLEAIIAEYEKRQDEMAEVISREMGAPINLARRAQAAAGREHLSQALAALRNYTFETHINNVLVTREPIGVCGFITPWNWPMNQIACKVGPALATGCTMVLKPSEVAPMSALLFSEIMHAAGVPAGVYNMVNGDGATAGDALSRHPEVDMVSFTGSTRAGILVAKAAADTVKRVHQELGGKSPNILLDDADFEQAVTRGVLGCFGNTGQSCNAPTRLLVPADRQAEVIEIAARVAATVSVGDPRSAQTTMGPVVSALQFERIQRLIEVGIAEGATLVAGGLGRPEGLETGYYVRPTIFADVDNQMSIARDEIFGPVLSILPYRSEEEAVAIANDTVYGLSSYVTSSDIERARGLARSIRAGMVHINGAPIDSAAPFGGYRQSGNGREGGVFGFEDFLEVKSIFGHGRS
ncbi:MAG: aldehyde dehydrogenase family protein [Bosea sp.]|uniref:aldehyde dehydrogenase family protein n=1 Tax=Bosea sp. (in: a-proteobacteria) TaxID=1871050 RepID=UPI001AC1760F|nr:aldehyde dehydrogenase family protein [Bosea sp. (in: a-proteobacteria)]MBN9451329.1 aldehyde dehydrogenase family protein [Bosea sp. (in: a-proteobacteria)]